MELVTYLISQSVN